MTDPAPDARAPRVKICGLRRAEDVESACAAGADYLGFVLSTGFGRSIEPRGAAPWVRDVEPAVVAVLVDETASDALRLGEALGADVLQLHGREPPAVAAALRARGFRVWKAVRAREVGDVEAAVERYDGVVDAWLVEGRRAGIVGGGGAALDPALHADLRRAVPLPRRLVVAGGLTPETVRGVVARTRPDVVDVSSGVESSRGVKDPAKVRRFVSEARGRAPTDPPTKPIP